MKPWKKWLLRVGLGAIGLPLLFVVGHRYYTRWEGETRLAKVQADLDAADPGWRLDDILAAREAKFPPDEENIITLVQRIHSQPPPQFADFGNRFPDWLPEERNRLPTTGVLAEAARVQEACRSVIEPARRIRHMTRGGWHVVIPNNPLGASLAHINNVRGVVALLHFDAIRSAHDGNPPEAVSSLHAALNTARAIGDEPFTISQLVRMAGSESVVDGLERTIGWTEPRAGLSEIQAVLTAEADAALLPIIYRGERALIDRVCAEVDDGSVTLTELLNDGPAGQEGWQDSLMYLLYRPHLPGNRSDLLREYTQLLGANREPPHDLNDLLAPRLELPHDYRLLLYGLLRPDWKKWTLRDLRTKARLRSAAAGIACERFRQANGRWPTTLAEIPKDILPAVPLDPYDGQPLRYRRTDDGAVVYAVGPDLADNEGNLSVKGDPGTDIGFRLWDVPHRRAAPLPPADDDGR